MPLAAIRAYIERLPRRLAEQRMMLAEAASVPHLKEPKRWWREVERAAGGVQKPKRAATPDVLARAGIGNQ